jgi:hypothetical protein
MQMRGVSWNWLCVMDLDFGINRAAELTQRDRESVVSLVRLSFSFAAEIL